MRKISGLLLAMTLALTTMAAPASVEPVKTPKLKASEVFIPIGTTGMKISLQDLATMKVKDLEQLTGQKMKFTDKVGFKMAQNQLAKTISPDGTINSKRLNKMAAKADGEGFHLGGFALGFLLGLIGVLIAYLIGGDNGRNRAKWAWIGLAAAVVLYLLAVVALI